VARRIDAQLAGQPGYRAVQAIDGVGPVLAAVFTAQIGDVHRFARAEQLCSWAGLGFTSHGGEQTFESEGGSHHDRVLAQPCLTHRLVGERAALRQPEEQHANQDAGMDARCHGTVGVIAELADGLDLQSGRHLHVIVGVERAA
jgi:hypothetical protein